MHVLRRFVSAVFVVSLSLSSSIGLVAAQPALAEVRPEAVRHRLMDAQWALIAGVLEVEAELKIVAGSDSGAVAVLESYRMQFKKQLAGVRTLQREKQAILSTWSLEEASRFLERIDQAHLMAWRLSSNFETYGLSRGLSLAPSGSSSCYGSIAGTVQGPSGPLDGVSVAAYTADGLAVGSALTLGDGSYQIDNLLAGQEYFVVTTNADALIDEVSDDVVCAGGTCDPIIGSPVSVSGGLTTAGIDFALASGGQIGGALTTPSPAGPIGLPLTTVNIFNAAGDLVTSAVSDFSGLYLTEGGLPAGTYHVVTAGLFFGNLDELYDDIPCPSGGSCDPTTGTPVVVTVPNITSGVDFELAAGGNVTGTITDSTTSQPLGNILVGIHDDTGQLVAFGASDATGTYTILSGLPTGNFFAATGNLNGYVDELYDDTPCTGGLCTITSGDQISVTLGATTTGIDFALSPGGTFSGRVTRADNGSPLADVFILGHTAAGDLVGTATTDSSGDYTLLNGLGTGSYRASTLNPLGLDDELFDNMSCPGGVCDVTVGAPITVTIGLDTPNVDFDLTGDTIISCAFEGCSTCGFRVVP